MIELIQFFMCALLGVCAEDACKIVEHANVDHVVCSYAADDIRVQLYLNDQNGKPYARLSRLERELEKPSLMLMNGGMYHADLGAVGLHIENGKQSRSISTKSGFGNFHLLPNGVFWGKNGALGVTETNAYISRKFKPDFATQSGPMLVIDGKLHPKFLKNSDSKKIRNGVGVSKDGTTVHFAISKGGVTFWNFGTLFQKTLKAHNALFLDGTVSAIKTDRYKQSSWRSIGPMIGVFKK